MRFPLISLTRLSTTIFRGRVGPPRVQVLVESQTFNLQFLKLKLLKLFRTENETDLRSPFYVKEEEEDLHKSTDRKISILWKNSLLSLSCSVHKNCTVRGVNVPLTGMKSAWSGPREAVSSAREKSSFKDTVEAWTGCSHLTVSTPPGEVMKVKWRGVRSLPLSLPYASFSAFSRRWPLAGVASFLPPSNTCSSKQHRSTWGPGGFSRACWSSSPMGRTRWTRTLAPGSNPLTASPGQCPTTATWPISSIFYEPRPFSWTWVIEEVISWEDSRVYVRRAYRCFCRASSISKSLLLEWTCKFSVSSKFSWRKFPRTCLGITRDNIHSISRNNYSWRAFLKKNTKNACFIWSNFVIFDVLSFSFFFFFYLKLYAAPTYIRVCN